MVGKGGNHEHVIGVDSFGIDRDEQASPQPNRENVIGVPT